jgi:hypothetical protein
MQNTFEWSVSNQRNWLRVGGRIEKLPKSNANDNTHTRMCEIQNMTDT